MDEWHGHWRDGDLSGWALAEVLRSRATAWADREFLRHGDGGWRTRGEVDTDARRIGNGLKARGLDPGEAVAVLLPDVPELVPVWFGIRKAGGVMVGLDPATPADELMAVLAASGARILITSTERLDAVAQGRARLPGLEHVLVLGARGPGRDPVHVEPFANLMDHTDAEPFGVEYRWDGGARITAALAGPALVPEAADHLAALTLLAFLDRTRDPAAGSCEDETFAAFMPSWERAAQVWCVRAALIAGARAALLPGDPAAVWREAGEAGATVVVLAPEAAERMAGAPPTGRERAHRVHTAVTGPVPAGVAAAFTERFGVRLFTGLLIPEAGMVACDDPRREPVPGSAGTAAPGHVLAVVDPSTDMPVPRGTPGELVVKPLVPNTVMRIHPADPAATTRAFRNLLLHTGREAVMDEDGHVHLRA
ncbi:MAG: AMP-binding protein [Thermoleophilia bacterium]